MPASAPFAFMLMYVPLRGRAAIAWAQPVASSLLHCSTAPDIGRETPAIKRLLCSAQRNLAPWLRSQESDSIEASARNLLTFFGFLPFSVWTGVPATA
jgi:hypothetical protein